MPRRAARTIVKSRKRQTKWCAQTSTAIVPNQGGLAIADHFLLCPGTSADQDAPDPLVGWCRGSISLSRLLVTEKNDAVAWAIVMMRTAPGTTDPVQTFNPFLPADLERQDILGMGYCAIPPIAFIPSTDASSPDSSATVTNINVKVGRRFHRNSNELVLWVVSFGSMDLGYEATFSIRSLMKFG